MLHTPVQVEDGTMIYLNALRHIKNTWNFFILYAFLLSQTKMVFYFELAMSLVAVDGYTDLSLSIPSIP